MSVRIRPLFTPTRTKLRNCEARLANVQAVALKHDRLATEAGNPAELGAALDDLWLVLFGFTRP